MVNLVIDGKKIEAETGTTILSAARDNGIVIPTLCHHESIEASGACRLCVVEIAKGGRKRIVTSCIYLVEDGIVVDTKSERVLGVRRLVLELLMARCPESEVVRNLAEELGVKTQKRFKPDKDKGKCILCRLCVKTCEDIVGVSAIGLSFRGKDKVVGPPFTEDSKACIGCGACAYVCPTGHIEMTTGNGGAERTIWGRTFKMAQCSVCGQYFAPEDQLQYISNKTGVPMENLTVCMNCRL
ncbi:2Fe-2S iron-sulfur cluster-binding protein [Syntrophus aciditrophicus]|uniref:2Fe-2S iron-sulfur cluster domain with dehydrogenase n=1 Tax=Syntrophus aciditrophicus (strain SB) TaxID=56780 RepID=Q2LYA8_SYNAS|nr:2Fe-2S iron-sulfur cluster-binding protein [Syntrophus aciditrophicus]ABC75968.1 2Fe-2S iron-sulfur cluster domain with dehydrogenase [Syntrophus aciditrophicus SB]